MSIAVLDEKSTDLAAMLVQIARERGSPVERLEAERLLAESRQAWPGDEVRMWSTWLAEGVKCLGLQARTMDASVSEAWDLIEDGAVVVCYIPARGAARFVRAANGSVELSHADGDVVLDWRLWPLESVYIADDGHPLRRNLLPIADDNGYFSAMVCRNQSARAKSGSTALAVSPS